MKKEELIAFLREDAGLSTDEFDDHTLLFTDGYIDSFTLTAMLAFIEDKLNIRIAASAVTVENFDSISRTMAYVGGLND
jgi:acyl carrier protein